MIVIRCLLLLCLLCIACSWKQATQADQHQPTANQLEFFEREVRPLLAKHCYQCHSTEAERVEASLLLDSRSSHLRGGDSGPAVVPGDVDASLLIEAVRYESYEMPPEGKLSEREIEALERWVTMGVPWPHEAVPTSDLEHDAFDLQKRKSEFWVWQPIADPKTPAIKDRTWPYNEVDHYTLVRMEEAGLKPSRDADRTAILRRVHFDLVGLPPSPAEISAFMGDSDPNAFERVVDRLLESPEFGERWGRHWLDLVRYAESRGHEFDSDIPNAFQYRDYVIRALNADVPYDQFVREHIAGDLVAEPRLHPTKKFNESVLGTGFWFLGEWVHSPVDVRRDEADRFDNMLDVMSKTFLGVTVACARCHDHKFDAISTADYYALSGFLQSSDYRQVRFESMEQNRRVARQLARVDDRYQRKLMKWLERNGVHPPKQTSGLTDEWIVVNYACLPQSQFLQDGFIFGPSPRRPGLPYLDDPPATGFSDQQTSHSKANDSTPLPHDVEDRPSVDTQQPKVTVATFGAAVSDSIWLGLRSTTEGVIHDRSAISKLLKSGRTLRTPTFELKHGRVNCLVEGIGTIVACVDSHRLVAGPLHKETIVPVKAGQRWVTLDLERYVGHRLHLEFVPAVDASMSVRLVTQGLDAEGRADLDQRLSELDEPYQAYARAVEAILNDTPIDSLNGKPTAAENVVALPSPTLAADRTEGTVHSTALQILRAWQRERKRLASRIVFRSRLAPAMMDGTGEDDRILIRGDSSKPGQVQPRHFLTAISGDSPISIDVGSGRLELARQINDPSNPLTSRVLVNRIWHHLMGRGIVTTVDDFGYLGQRPTHPRLLDHLAARFRRDGLSIKRMIKYILMSRTYQLSSHPGSEAAEADPKNRLWHHRPPRRLQGEVIRDSLLEVSGRLDSTLFGPPVPIHLTSFMDGRGRPGVSGPLDGDRRRSIYIAVRRNFLSPFMLTFDTPAPFSSMGRRNVSNVPAQALTLLNDPLVATLSSQWGRRALTRVSGTDNPATHERIEWMYLSGFGRYPTSQESDAAIAFLTSQASERNLDTNAAELWENFAHVLVNTKEFIFLR